MSKVDEYNVIAFAEKALMASLKDAVTDKIVSKLVAELKLNAEKEFKAAGEWTSVEDELPSGNKHSRYLVYTPKNKQIEYRLMPLHMVFSQSRDFTHWMPLPAPPADA